MAKKKENEEAKKKDNENVDREKKREEKVVAANKQKEEVEANVIKVDNKKDVNTIKANDNLETEETGSNADDTSDKETMRKKARKGRKKARKDKRAREQDANTNETPVHSPPSGLQRATYRFVLPRSALKFDDYDHKFKREHVTASVILKQDEKYNEVTMK